jgi:hypothetical protein
MNIAAWLQAIPPDVRGGVLTLLGTLLGAAVTAMVIRRQTKSIEDVSRDEQRIGLLVDGARLARLSAIQIEELDYSKSWRSSIDPTSWGPAWRPLADTLTRLGTITAIFREELRPESTEQVNRLLGQIVASRRSHKGLVAEYGEAIIEVRRDYERLAREQLRRDGKANRL